MKFLRVVFLVISINLGNMIYAQGSYIPYKEEVVVDGRIKEWPVQFPLITFTQNNIPKFNSNTISIYAGWNETNLFIAFKVDDRNLVLLSNDSTKTYLNDAVEFYIDPFSDSKEKMDVNDFQFIINIENQVSILKGDYRKTDSIDVLAPKEQGITTLVFKSATQIMGKINEPGIDTGYIVELAIPLAAIGIIPMEGVKTKMDFCVNDADSLLDIAPIPDTAEVPGFFYSSWKGSRDFSYPSEWSVFELKGKPSWFGSFLKVNTKLILCVGISILLLAGITIIWLLIRISQLKNVPKKAGLQQLIDIQKYIDEPINIPDSLKNNEDKITSEVKLDGVSIFEEKASPKEEPLVIKKARNYIQMNIENEIELEKLSRECAVSSRQLQRIFKDHLNITPSNFIVILKMEEASSLLKVGEKNVTEIAYHLGYSDPAYFTRVFKKYFGYPPSKTPK